MTSLRIRPLPACWLCSLGVLLLLPSARAEMFALHIYETPAAIAARTDPEKGPAYWNSFAQFGDRLKGAGVLRGGGAFQTGDTVRTVKAGTSTPGPLVTEPTASLSGYFVIEVSRLDEAVTWAAQVPAAAVEIHPYYPVPGMK